MSSIRAIVVDPAHTERLVLQEVAAPQPGWAEALIQVKAISLNRGEVNSAMSAEAGWRPGWDLAGTVLAPAADGTGPKQGARVVGMVPNGAWAEQVAVSTSILAELPEQVSFEQAATLPVAGLTALRALEKGGLLLQKRVLITGSTGGVGTFALQLARLAGAHVVGIARNEARVQAVKNAGAHDVVVGDDAGKAEAYGPYDLILDSVGGSTLAKVLPLLASNGTCVVFGASGGGYQFTFDLSTFFPKGGVTLYGLILFNEFTHRPGAGDLAHLAQLLASGQLNPGIEVTANWKEIGTIAQRLLKREYAGKAVLRVE